MQSNTTSATNSVVVNCWGCSLSVIEEGHNKRQLDANLEETLTEDYSVVQKGIFREINTMVDLDTQAYAVLFFSKRPADQGMGLNMIANFIQIELVVLGEAGNCVPHRTKRALGARAQFPSLLLLSYIMMLVPHSSSNNLLSLNNLSSILSSMSFISQISLVILFIESFNQIQ